MLAFVCYKVLHKPYQLERVHTCIKRRYNYRLLIEKGNIKDNIILNETLSPTEELPV